LLLILANFRFWLF